MSSDERTVTVLFDEVSYKTLSRSIVDEDDLLEVTGSD
jgi:hypothetical protein